MHGRETDLPRHGVQVLRLYAFCLFSLSNVLIPSVPSPVALPAAAARELLELLAPFFLLLPEYLEDFVVAEEAGSVVEGLRPKWAQRACVATAGEGAAHLHSLVLYFSCRSNQRDGSHACAE